MHATAQMITAKSAQTSTMEFLPAEAAIMAVFHDLPRLEGLADDAQAALADFEQDTPAHDAARLAMCAARENLKTATAAVVESEVDSPLVMAAKLTIYGDFYNRLRKCEPSYSAPSTSLNGMAELIVRDLRRQHLAG